MLHGLEPRGTANLTSSPQGTDPLASQKEMLSWTELSLVHTQPYGGKPRVDDKLIIALYMVIGLGFFPGTSTASSTIVELAEMTALLSSADDKMRQVSSGGSWCK